MAYADIQLEAPEAGLSKNAPAEELYRLGLVYSTGMGVPVNFIAAHKWFNLAAARGHRDAKICRAEMTDLLTAADLVKAQRAAREWIKLAN
jgi:TPR repeat protein